jgi:uncharacterized protein
VNPTLTTIASLAALALPVTGLAFLGRKVVMPKKPSEIDISIDTTANQVTLPITPLTTSSGEHGLWFQTSHARIGRIVSRDEQAELVVREIIKVTGMPLETGSVRGRWSGHAIGHPDHVKAAEAEDIVLKTPHGDAPAWVIRADGEDDGKTWAVHVHGIRTSRHSALRSVPVAMSMGMTSVVPSYWGDQDNTSRGVEPCYLGQREWEDVETALDYAVERGAENIVLFGWSMGATISLLLTERSRHRDRIRGLILISPATNSTATLTVAAQNAGIPAFFAGVVPWVLSVGPLARLSGLDEAIDYSAVDWTQPGRLKVPALLIHSDGDTDVPAEFTRQFAARNPGYTTTEIFDAVPHQLEWNTAPEKFEQTVVAWARNTGLI